MENAILAYKYEGAALRAINVDGEPWFVATDVAAILGFRDAPNMLRGLDEDEKGYSLVSTLGGDQNVIIVTESGLYHAIFRSRREEAKRFRKWVTSEVLPAIRRTGTYALYKEDPARRIMASIHAVDAARRLYGKDGAAQVWDALGLPKVMTRAAAEDQPDPLIPHVEQVLIQLGAVTVRMLTERLELRYNERTRARLSGILSTLAAERSFEEREGRKVSVFRPKPD